MSVPVVNNSGLTIPECKILKAMIDNFTGVGVISGVDELATHLGYEAPMEMFEGIYNLEDRVKRWIATSPQVTQQTASLKKTVSTGKTADEKKPTSVKKKTTKSSTLKKRTELWEKVGKLIYPSSDEESSGEAENEGDGNL